MTPLSPNDRQWLVAELARRDEALAAHARQDEVRHASELESGRKLERDTDRRLNDMNHFREQINTERASYLPRDMYEREHDGLSERVKSLEIVRGEQTGKAAAYASIVGILVIAVQVILHFWKQAP
jgi:hypothetical protein